MEVGNSNELCIKHRCQGMTGGIIHTLRGCPCPPIVVYLIRIVFYLFYVYFLCIARILSVGGRCA